jgi:hypothetical protein
MSDSNIYNNLININIQNPSDNNSSNNNNNNNNNPNANEDKKLNEKKKLIPLVPDLDEFDPSEDSPQLIVGHYIWLLWAHNRYYRGQITEFNQLTGLHHISYDDGEQKDYNLIEKTFRIDKSNYIYRGQTGGDNIIRSAWNDYIPRLPNIVTNVTFNVIIDHTILQNGEVLSITGTTPSLGQLNRSISMQRLLPNEFPNVWSVAVALPFLLAEQCNSGIFEYKYAIINTISNETIQEAGFNRRENSVQHHYYSIFNPVKGSKLARFKSYKKISHKTALITFINKELLAAVVNEGSEDYSVTNLCDRFDRLASCLDGRRDIFEEAVNLFIKTYDSQYNVRERSNILLILAAAIGQFNLSSKDRNSADQSFVANSWGTVMFNNSFNNQTITRPDSSEWCCYLIDNLPLAHSYTLDYKQLFSADYQLWPILGLREAAERFYLEANYSFIRLFPLLKLSKNVPDTSEKGEKNKQLKRRCDNYSKALESVKLLIQNSSQSHAMELSLNQSAKSEESVSMKLCRDWLQSLIRFAPSLENFIQLLADNSIINHIEMIQADIAAWLRSNNLNSAADIRAVNKLLSNNNKLKLPNLVAAVLSNESLQVLNDAKLELELFNLLTNCAGDKYLISSSAAAAAVAALPSSEEEEKKLLLNNTDNPSSNLANVSAKVFPTASLSMLDSSWLELESSAKEYFRRYYCNEVVDKDESNNNSMQMFGLNMMYSSFFRPTPVKLSPAQLAEKRLRFLIRSSDVMNSFLNLPFFSARPGGLLFEFSRSYLFKGDCNVIVHIICLLAKQSNGLEIYQAALKEFLQTRAVRAIEEVVPTLSAALQKDKIFTQNNAENVENNSVNSLFGLIDLINANTPKNSALNHDLLAALLHNSGVNQIPPALNSILVNEQIWQKILSGRKIEAKNANSALELIVSSTYQLLLATANNLLDNTISLQALHVVLKYSQSFLNLLVLMNIQSINPNILSDHSATLQSFDISLAQFKCFVNFWCSCGVKIDSSDLSELVSSLTSRYNSLQLNNISTAFQSFAPLQSHIAWLYELRNSQLFLNLWRLQGKRAMFNLLKPLQTLINPFQPSDAEIPIAPAIHGNNQFAPAYNGDNSIPVILTNLLRVCIYYLFLFQQYLKLLP